MVVLQYTWMTVSLQADSSMKVFPEKHHVQAKDVVIQQSAVGPVHIYIIKLHAFFVNEKNMKQICKGFKTTSSYLTGSKIRSPLLVYATQILEPQTLFADCREQQGFDQELN